jgi:flagellar biosynthetic protein FliP
MLGRKPALLLATIAVCGCASVTWAQTAAEPPAPSGVDAAAEAVGSTDPIYIPDITHWLPRAGDRQSISSTLQIVVLMTLLTVAPSIILMMTCFVRMVIVLVLLRQALGTQTLPPSQIITGLALFMTLLVMSPVWERIRSDAVNPYLSGGLEQTEAISIAGGHLRAFMFRQIEAAGNEQDVYLMYEYAARTTLAPTDTLLREQVPTTALIPAFILSELKAAFLIGFRIYLPFLVIDMVIATVLVSMGMMMLPPVLVSLPFKLLLFSLADGWHLVGGSLMASVV